MSERAARGEKGGECDVPFNEGFHFLPLQNRTVSHQSLCLPLISQLRDLAPDKPLSV